MRASILFILVLSSIQLHAKATFMNFDFIDGQIENGLRDWYYSDIGKNPCDVYNGQNQSKLCGPNGLKIYPYYSNYNNSHMGWKRYGYIDSSSNYSVSGSSLKIQMTGGVYKNSSGKLADVGVLARAKSERFSAASIAEENIPKTLPGDMSIYVKTSSKTTEFQQFQGKNRFSVWVLMPYRSVDINKYSTAHMERPDQKFSWYPFIGAEGGSHYYHNASNIPMGGWTKVQFDAHPTHHNSGSNNAYSAFSTGGYSFPGKAKSYFNNITTFALRAKFSINQPVDTSYYLDEFEVDYVEFENEETINNVGVGYNPDTQQFDVSFEDKYRCLTCNAIYELKYSFNPITNHNFDNAHTPAYTTNFDRSKNNKDGNIFKPNPGYNLVWAAMDLKAEHRSELADGHKIYFAIKDISKRENITQQPIDTDTVTVPGLGEIANIDLIKSIEYTIIPVSYPLQLMTEPNYQAVVGQKFEQNLQSIGGTKPYTYSATNLPSGLTLSQDGKLAGMPLKKGQNEAAISIIDNANKVVKKDIILNVLTPDDLKVKFCKLIVDFKSSDQESNISDSRFKKIFKDEYTGFYDLGTTITIGNNKNYDYQGVEGTGFSLSRGDKVRLTWKNISPNVISFTPRISFSKQSRFEYDDRAFWENSSKVEIKPNQFATSILEVQSSIESTFVNVNVNYSNNKTLILDKIEFVEQNNLSSNLCEGFSSQKSIEKIVIVDFNNSYQESQTELPYLSQIIKDKYTDFWENGMATVIGSNGMYNFQGVKGSGYELITGDTILVSWFNESEKDIDFSPKLSLRSTTRMTYSDPKDWLALDNLTLNAKSSATSKFEITNELQGLVNVINVSNAKNLHKTVILDKIELVPVRQQFNITSDQLISANLYKNLTLQFITNNYESDILFETNSYLPKGIVLTSEGKLIGSPEEYGNFEIEVSAFNSDALTVTKTFNIIIEPENDVYVQHCKSLVDFNGFDNNLTIDAQEFHTIIHDVYTGPSIGIGMTNVIGSHKDYNFQGILGEFVPKKATDKIRTVWYNNSEQHIEFSPRISFTNFGRVNVDEPQVDWSYMEMITIPPREFMVSNFNLEKYLGASYDGININVNYSNNNILILDRIEYVSFDLPQDSVCKSPRA
ncbi:MAG: hypothetical protein ACI9YH_000482 [Colwellia sp.]